jgi:hypothetical protein
VESSCKLGNEPSGSIKCWELLNGCTTCGLSSSTQLHRVSQLCVQTLLLWIVILQVNISQFVGVDSGVRCGVLKIIPLHTIVPAFKESFCYRLISCYDLENAQASI